ncbi:hypothetical protein FVE85_4510 [Porphyridium purpureum]|uniref:Uncharacterized protein n=1 Tax=Porphyridium purpureum TaxID=35688 RepID=A0A5J4YKA7_PORPP|nr:hypothetical protein FVE85_4510 [Porphyridium purpureum]|eukprot:POR6737..scf297_16
MEGYSHIEDPRRPQHLAYFDQNAQAYSNFLATAAAVESYNVRRAERAATPTDLVTNANTRINGGTTYEPDHVVEVSDRVFTEEKPDEALEQIANSLDTDEQLPFWLIPNAAESSGDDAKAGQVSHAVSLEKCYSSSSSSLDGSDIAHEKSVRLLLE